MSHSGRKPSADDRDAASFAQQREEFGRILGLDHAVSEDVMVAALAHPSYASNLLVCRGTPAFLEQLLANPPANPPARAEPTLAGLLQNGAAALLRWGRDGFARADEAVRRRRLELCEACPNLSAPPEGRAGLYALVGTAAASRSVCRLCGCPVTRKAGIAGEACPDAHPDRPGLTRWEEPSSPRS